MSDEEEEKREEEERRLIGIVMCVPGARPARVL